MRRAERGESKTWRPPYRIIDHIGQGCMIDGFRCIRETAKVAKRTPPMNRGCDTTCVVQEPPGAATRRPGTPGPDRGPTADPDEKSVRGQRSACSAYEEIRLFVTCTSQHYTDRLTQRGRGEHLLWIHTQSPPPDFGLSVERAPKCTFVPSRLAPLLDPDAGGAWSA